MQNIDDDSTLTSLATAWVNVAVGGAKYQEAAYIFQELMDKFGSSVSLLNGKACALMHMKRFSDAEKLLVDAMGMSSTEPDTLINLITCSENLQKPSEIVLRYTRQLEDLCPDHTEAKSRKALDGMFDKLAVSYAPEVAAA